MWNVFFGFIVEVDIFGDASRKMCGLLWRWLLPPRTTSRKSEEKKKITDISPVNSIHVGKSCQQEQGHSFKLMSVSSDRLWMAEWRCSGRNKALCHRASLLSVIDHRQNQQLSFVKDSFLLPHFLSPFPCLSLSQRSLLLTSWERPSAREGDLAPDPPAGFCTLQVPANPPDFWILSQG